MSTAFDMELFLAGVLTGSHATPPAAYPPGQGHPGGDPERWQLDNPRAWQRKHLNWFLVHHLSQRAESTRYYYLLTAQLIAKRLGKAWQFNR
ncbi:MAG TPA: hypothetical protein VJA19_04295 [Pseudomonas sp.]|nr:hypothetical protein [Pseudomonas sp.]